MRSDLTRVRQILFNLLSNACKFTEDGNGGTECRQPYCGDGLDCIVFQVSDSGIGMTPDSGRQGFRGIRPGRFVHDPQIRRNRARAGHHAEVLRDDGRRYRSRERAGKGIDIHGAAAEAEPNEASPLPAKPRSALSGASAGDPATAYARVRAGHRRRSGDPGSDENFPRPGRLLGEQSPGAAKKVCAARGTSGPT